MSYPAGFYFEPSSPLAFNVSMSPTFAPSPRHGHSAEGPRHHRHAHHPSHGHHMSRPRHHQLDLDAQEQHLVQQLEAVRLAKATAERERQQAEEARRVEQVRARAIAAQVQRQQQQQRQARVEQAQRAARQESLARAIRAAKLEAAQIEQAKERARQVALAQAQAQQMYMFEQRRLAEEERRRNVQAEQERRRIAYEQQREAGQQERLFWNMIERLVHLLPSPLAWRQFGTHLYSCPLHNRSLQPELAACHDTCSKDQVSPRESTQVSQPRQEKTEATQPASEDRFTSKDAEFPIDFLRMLFGPGVVIEGQDDVEQPTGSHTETPKQIPTTTAPGEIEPTSEPAKPSRQLEETSNETISAEEFLDHLFGAIGALNSEEPEKSGPSQVSTKAQPQEQVKDTGAGLDEQESVEQTPQETEKPTAAASGPTAGPLTDPTPPELATGVQDASASPAISAQDASASPADDIPLSAADLEAEKSQATADLIQARYRQHLLRVNRLEKLEKLENKLKNLDRDWKFPETLDFMPTSEKASVGDTDSIFHDPVDSASSLSETLVVPPLAFTQNNVPYHAHAQALLNLLVAADSVSSDGDDQVRNARKEFVRQVEGKLAEMEVQRRAVWEKVKNQSKDSQEQDENTKSKAQEFSESEDESEVNKPVKEKKPVEEFVVV